MWQHQIEMNILKITLSSFLFFIEQVKGDDILSKTMIESIEAAGYCGEQHEAVTEDGYILTVHRVLNCKNGASNKKKTPVCVIHGTGGSSKVSIDLGQKSLAYLLAKNNYDVWLGNLRGNIYTAHKKLSRNNPRFWDYSWDEHAKYDLPATWDLVLEKTNSSKIIGVGYSLGFATTMANLADSEKYQSKFFSIFGMAPVSRLTYSTNEEYKIIGRALPALKVVGPFLVGPYINPSVLSCLQCTIHEFLVKSDSNMGLSLKTIFHGLQLTKSNQFQHFNKNLFGNLIQYHSLFPPVYDLTKVNVSVFLYSSANDDLADPIDVARLQMDLPNVISHRIIKDYLFSHIDFVAHKDADEYVYNPMIKDMQSIETLKTIN